MSAADEAIAWRESVKIRGRNVVPITKATFPVGRVITVESIIHGNTGWEFDAPLHFMRPFHLHCITGSACTEAINRKLEDLLIDLDCEKEIPADTDAWPFRGETLKRIFVKAQRREAQGVFYYRSKVRVRRWSAPGAADADWVIETKEFQPKRRRGS